jgi:hypothetical protein
VLAVREQGGGRGGGGVRGMHSPTRMYGFDHRSSIHSFIYRLLPLIYRLTSTGHPFIRACACTNNTIQHHSMEELCVNSPPSRQTDTPDPRYLTFRHAIKEGTYAEPGKQLILGGET